MLYQDDWLPCDDSELPLPGVAMFKIAGLSHHGVAAQKLKPHDIVILEPDPSNEYDPNAVKVTLDGALVGFVPKTLAPTIAAQLRGKQCEAAVVRTYKDKNLVIATEVVAGIAAKIDWVE